MPSSDNPFLYGSIVNKTDFCNRDRLSKRLVSHFGNGQNSVLMGPRRVGKSSLIHHSASRVKGATLIYVDFWGAHSYDDFIRRCVQALDVIEDKTSLFQKISRAIPGLSVSVGTDPISGLPTFTPVFNQQKKAAPESVSQLTQLWAALAEENKIIIALDEFQDVGKIENSEQLFGLLRKEIQLLGKVPFCFCGSVRNEMWRLFAEDDGAFYKSCAILEVSETDFDDWHGFLKNKFSSTGVKIEDEQLETICSIADHNPGDTQQLCSSVWEKAKFQNRRKITDETINKALVQVFADEKKGYEQVVADVSAQQLCVLRGIAHLGGESIQSSEFLNFTGITQASSSKAAATRLLQRRILQKSTKGFKFSNPFFKEWLLYVRY